MNKINTFLFDIDGTILDTREFIIQAAEHSLPTLGYFVPERRVIAQNVGKPFEEFYFCLTGSEKDIEKLMDAHRAFQAQNFNLAKIFPHSLQTLKTLKERGHRLAAVTSRSKKTSHQTLIDAGIFDLFDTVISSEDAGALKPDPAPLFKALEFMGELPERAVMIGDSHLDIEAGINAGTKTVRVKYGFHTDRLNEPKPDFFIDDIEDLLKLL
ncbi:MAG: HAD-IA family hydrolase [Patescibacteria group bacterium]